MRRLVFTVPLLVFLSWPCWLPACGSSPANAVDAPPADAAPRIDGAASTADAPAASPDAPPASADAPPASPDAPPASPDAPPPPITLDPDAHDFGSVVLDDQPAFTFTVRNPADVPSDPLTVTVDGDEFLLGAFSTCGAAPLAAHASCDAIVVFSPTSAGTATGTLHVDAGARHLSADLMGKGVTAGVLGANPDMIRFDPLVVGQMSGTRSVTITNGGQSTSGAISVAVTGSDAASFSVSSGCNGVQLDASKTCSFTVTFAPTVRGDNAASIEVQAIPGGTTTVDVSGKGLAPALLGTSADHDFGTVATGTSQSFDFPVTNLGDVATGPLQFVSSGNKLRFSVTDDCPTALAAGDSCKVTVTYAPLIQSSSAIEIDVSAAPGGTIVLTAEGMAVAAATLTVTPSDGVTVTSDPAGIDCGATCSHAYVPGTMVELTAETSGADVLIVGWGGDCTGVADCGASPTCLVTVEKSCSASPILAAPGQALLVLDRSGTGSVRSTPDGIDCVDGICTTAHALFDAGSTVTLTPYGPMSIPPVPTTFKNVKWEGCTSIDDNDMSCSVDLGADGATVSYSCTPTRVICENVIILFDDRCGSAEPCVPPPP